MTISQFLRFGTCLSLTLLAGCSGCRQATKSEPTAESQPPAESKTTSEDTPVDKTTEPIDVAGESASSSTAEAPASSSESGGPSSPAGGTTSEPTSKSPQKSLTPDEAMTAAGGLQEGARAAAKRGNHGDAFKLATQAWDTARRFPNDGRLKDLTNELAAEIERYASQANSKASSSAGVSGKTLIEK